jgi:hypothetical protein
VGHDLSQAKSVSGVQVLVLNQNLVDVVRMCRAAGEMISENLKDVAQATRIVNVDVGHTFVALHEESQLQVSEVISSLEAARRRKPNKLSRQMVEASGNLIKQSRVGAILHFLSQLLLYKREEAVTS